MCGFLNIPWYYILVYKDSRHFDGTPIKVCRCFKDGAWSMWRHCVFFSFFVVPLFILLILLQPDMLHITQHKRWWWSQGHLSLPTTTSAACPSHKHRSLLVLVFSVFHIPYRASVCGSHLQTNIKHTDLEFINMSTLFILWEYYFISITHLIQ